MMFKTKEELLNHLHEVKRRKEERQRQAVADYQRLMKETEEDRRRIHEAIFI